MRQMKGQAVFNGSGMGLTIGLLNFVGPVAASASKCCQNFQSLLPKEPKGGGVLPGRAWGYSQLSFMNSFKESFWTSFFLGAAQPRQQGQARQGVGRWLPYP